MLVSRHWDVFVPGILVSAQAAWTPGLHERAKELGVHAYDYLVEPDAAGLRGIAQLVECGKLRVHIAERLPLADAARALTISSQGRTSGKIILTVV